MPKISTGTTLPLRREDDPTIPRAVRVAPDTWAITRDGKTKAFVKVVQSLVDGGVQRVLIIHPGQRAGVGGGETTDVLEARRIAQSSFPGAEIKVMGLDPANKVRNSIAELERALGGLTEVGDFLMRDSQGRLVIDGRFDPAVAADVQRGMNASAAEIVRAQDVVITGGAAASNHPYAVATDAPDVPRGRTNFFMRELNAPFRATYTPNATFGIGAGGELLRDVRPGVRTGIYTDPALRELVAQFVGPNAGPSRIALLEQMLGSRPLAEALAGTRWGTVYLPNMPDGSVGFDATTRAYVQAAAAQANALQADGRGATVFIFSNSAFDAIRPALEAQGIAVDDLRENKPAALPERAGVRFVVVPRQTPEVYRGTVAGTELVNLVTGANTFQEAVMMEKAFIYHSLRFKTEMIQEYLEVAREAMTRRGVPQAQIDRFVESFPRVNTEREALEIERTYQNFRNGFAPWLANQGAELVMPERFVHLPYFYAENTRRIRAAQGDPMSQAEFETLLRESYGRMMRAQFTLDPLPESAAALFGGDPAEVRELFKIAADAINERSFQRDLTRTVLQDFRTATLMDMLKNMTPAERGFWAEMFSFGKIPGAKTFLDALKPNATPAALRDAALLYDRPEFREAVRSRLNSNGLPTLRQAYTRAAPHLTSGVLALLGVELAMDKLGIQDRGARFLTAFPAALLAQRGLDHLGQKIALRYDLFNARARAAVTAPLTAAERAAARSMIPRGMGTAIVHGTFANAVVTGVMNQLGFDPRGAGYRALAFGSIFLPDLAKVGLSTVAPEAALSRFASVVGRAAFWIGLLKLVDDAGGIVWDWTSSTAAYDRMVGERARELKSEALKRDSAVARALLPIADFLANTFGRNSTAAFQRQQWRDVAADEIKNDARVAEIELGKRMVAYLDELGAKPGTRADTIQEIKKRISEKEELRGVIDFLRITAPSGHGSKLIEIFRADGTVDDAALERYLLSLRGANPPSMERIGETRANLLRLEELAHQRLPSLPEGAGPEEVAAALEKSGTAENRALAGELRMAVLVAESLELQRARADAVEAGMNRKPKAKAQPEPSPEVRDEQQLPEVLEQQQQQQEQVEDEPRKVGSVPDAGREDVAVAPDEGGTAVKAGAQKDAATVAGAGAQKDAAAVVGAGAQEDAAAVAGAGAQKDAAAVAGAGAQKDAATVVGAGAQKDAATVVRAGTRKDAAKALKAGAQKDGENAATLIAEREAAAAAAKKRADEAEAKRRLAATSVLSTAQSRRGATPDASAVGHTIEVPANVSVYYDEGTKTHYGPGKHVVADGENVLTIREYSEHRRPRTSRPKPIENQSTTELVTGINDALSGPEGDAGPRVGILWLDDSDPSKGVRVKLNRLTLTMNYRGGEWVVDRVEGKRSVATGDTDKNGKPVIDVSPVPPNADRAELLAGERKTQEVMDEWRGEQREKKEDEATKAREKKQAEDRIRELADARSDRNSRRGELRRLEQILKDRTAGGQPPPKGLPELIERKKAELAQAEANVTALEARQAGEGKKAPANGGAQAPANGDAQAPANGGAQAPANGGATPETGKPEKADAQPEGEPIEEPIDPETQRLDEVSEKADDEVERLKEELEKLEDRDAPAGEIEKKKRELAAAEAAAAAATRAYNMHVDPVGTLERELERAREKRDRAIHDPKADYNTLAADVARLERELEAAKAKEKKEEEAAAAAGTGANGAVTTTPANGGATPPAGEPQKADAKPSTSAETTESSETAETAESESIEEPIDPETQRLDEASEKADGEVERLKEELEKLEDRDAPAGEIEKKKRELAAAEAAAAAANRAYNMHVDPVGTLERELERAREKRDRAIHDPKADYEALAADVARLERELEAAKAEEKKKEEAAAAEEAKKNGAVATPPANQVQPAPAPKNEVQPAAAPKNEVQPAAAPKNEVQFAVHSAPQPTNVVQPSVQPAPQTKHEVQFAVHSAPQPTNVVQPAAPAPQPKNVVQPAAPAPQPKNVAQPAPQPTNARSGETLYASMTPPPQPVVSVQSAPVQRSNVNLELPAVRAAAQPQPSPQPAQVATVTVTRPLINVLTPVQANQKLPTEQVQVAALPPDVVARRDQAQRNYLDQFVQNRAPQGGLVTARSGLGGAAGAMVGKLA